MTRHTMFLAVASAALLSLAASCSDDDTSSASLSGAGGSGGASGTGSASGGATGSATGGNGTGGSGTSESVGVGGFSPATTGTGGGGSGCDNTLIATVRDFQTAHPDFETYGGSVETVGLVMGDIGANNKPVFAQVGNPQQLTGATEFAQWYVDTPGINQAIPITLTLVETTPGTFSYTNSAFFPVDGQGWGNEGNPNNFHFTTEIHTSFDYLGGEVFTFSGDDDLWLFINGKLALDLGGLHPEVTGTVDLDASAAALGITVGGSYAMDIFHAERHTTASNFRIDTTINCFVPPPS